MDPEGAIIVDQLRRVFDRRPPQGPLVAVDDISFQVAAGERVAFIGPNGAGKSTSIKIVSGLLYPTSGSASVLGFTPWSQRQQLAYHIGSLFGQRSQLWTELPAQATFRLLGKVFGLSKAETSRRVSELGEALDATDLFSQPVNALSLGQRMRAELAACLLHRPRLLFLDEPTIGLDLLAKQRFRELLVQINQDFATTVFLTSHDVADVEHVAERVLVVNHGRLIFDDKLTAMQQQYLTTKRVTLSVAEQVEPETIERLTQPGIEVASHGEYHLVADVDTHHLNIETALRHLLGAVTARDFTVSDPSLEQVITSIYTAEPDR